MKHLLNSVNLIISKYKEIEKVSGESFNIFSIMGMESDEVRTHSAIINELLNPNGSHGLNEVPLELFLKEVFSDSFQFNCKTASCKKEVYIGLIDENFTKGGRIDLLINDHKGNVIVIENKIYAPEQKNQLLRYQQRYSQAKILYLTLDGEESQEKNIIYHRISYKEHILNWVEKCIELATDKPIVREMLVHYSFLIKGLTNQTLNKKMGQEIINIIESNFEASAEIYKNFQKVLEIKQSYFLKNLSESIEVELNKSNRANWDVKICQESNDKLANKVEIISKDLNVSFHFKNYKNPLILINRNSGNTEDTESQFKKIRDDLGFKAPDWKTETTLLWQHKWNNLGDAENLINAEKLNKHEEISDFLMEVIDNIDEALCSKKPKQ